MDIINKSKAQTLGSISNGQLFFGNESYDGVGIKPYIAIKCSKAEDKYPSYIAFLGDDTTNALDQANISQMGDFKKSAIVFSLPETAKIAVSLSMKDIWQAGSMPGRPPFGSIYVVGDRYFLSCLYRLGDKTKTIMYVDVESGVVQEGLDTDHAVIITAWEILISEGSNTRQIYSFPPKMTAAPQQSPAA